MIAKREEKENEIYFQTFIGHTADALKILKCYFELKSDVLVGLCERWNLDQKIFMKDLFLMVSFHDIGKLTLEFQRNIKAGKHSPDYPHSFWALPIISQVPFTEYDQPYPLLAILGHHTQLNAEIYGSVKKEANYCFDEIQEFSDQNLRDLYKQFGFEKYFNYQIAEIKKPNRLKVRHIRERYIKPCTFRDPRIKSVYTYMLSILQLCDDYSSAHFSKFIESFSGDSQTFDGKLEKPEDYVLRLTDSKTEFKKRIFKENHPYPFQEELACKKEPFSFLFAPCGRGKTEAALNWAREMIEVNHCDRIIFALPTQVTCNAMYDRFIENEDGYGFERKYIGLFHGKSYLALEEKLMNYEEEKDYNLLKDENFKGSVFLKPITVTTIDHLAYALVHGFSQADFACGNLQSSVVIFDEIHYYETHTLNNLLVVFQKLREMEIPHLLMTGTAPQFLLDSLNEQYTIIRDDEGLAFQPFIIPKPSDQSILKNNIVLESIVEDYLSGKKVFIILNQVAWTQDFYHDLVDEFKKKQISPNIYLYHSHYVYSDRINKETEIKKASVSPKPCIIIATQVIEISLNISCDVMYSQIAPPDALGQRAGRLNRSGKHYSNGFDYEMKLFIVEKYRPYEKDLLETSLLNLPTGPCSYMMIKEFCDKVYGNRRLIPNGNYYKYFERNILFGDRPKEVTWGEDQGKGLIIRESNYQTIDIIPYKFAEFILHGGDFNRYKLQIPYYIYLKNKEYFCIAEEKFKYPIIYCHYPYTYELGLEIKMNENFDDRAL